MKNSIKIFLPIITISVSLMSLQSFANSKKAVHNLKQLVCNSKISGNYQLFTVDLDPASFSQNSKLVLPKNAQIQHGFYFSSLNCIGSKVNNFQCIGFVNGTSDLIEVKTQSNELGEVTASYEMLRGEGPSDGELSCVVN